MTLELERCQRSEVDHVARPYIASTYLASSPHARYAVHCLTLLLHTANLLLTQLNLAAGWAAGRYFCHSSLWPIQEPTRTLHVLSFN